MADMYIATAPRCPTHQGQMKWVHPKDSRGVYLPSYWVCLGWDGEGCDHRVAEAQVDWVPVKAEQFTLRGVEPDAILRMIEEGTWKTNGPG